MNKVCETGPPVYRPYPRRLESLIICRCHYKDSTFSSVLLSPFSSVIYRFCNLRKWKDFNKKKRSLLKMCVTSLLCGPRADLWPFYGFLCKRFSLYSSLKTCFLGLLFNCVRIRPIEFDWVRFVRKSNSLKVWCSISFDWVRWGVLLKVGWWKHWAAAQFRKQGRICGTSADCEYYKWD